MAGGTANALLVIADIGGYTRFMSLHRTSLAHAQENTSRLLEAIIDAAPALELAELEGDAAFLYVTDPTAADITRSLAGLASAVHRAFHEEQAYIASRNACPCDGCRQTGTLTVKVVAHHGEVVLSTTRGRSTLAGVDVILVHRMLKNSVPIGEYVLMTGAVLDRAEPRLRELATPIEEQLEGLGTQQLHYVDMAVLAESAGAAAREPEPATLLQRAAFTAGLTARGLPYLVGLRRARVEVEG